MEGPFLPIRDIYKPASQCLTVLRRANDDETAAFLLVERTMRRARPLVSPRGLRSMELPDGRMERDLLGRLRFRFDGHASDFEPENGNGTGNGNGNGNGNGWRSRKPSEDEVSRWRDLERIVDASNPVADAEWNLVSMNLGPRVLRRLPLGRVVAFVPDGTPPYRAPDGLRLPQVVAEPEIPAWTEAEILAMIDEFLHEADRYDDTDPRLMQPWKPGTAENRAGNHGVMAPWSNGHKHSRGKWARCPICHTPVVKDRFNPRIPVGSLRPGAGSIRDLRGGYLSRLRETYLLPETNSLVEPRESR